MFHHDTIQNAMKELPKHILIVCTGNICRSPLAAAILGSTAKKRGFKALEVLSAGTEGYKEGEGADLTVMQIARSYGLDLSTHVAKQVSLSDIHWADLIIVMDTDNLLRLREMFGDSLQQKVNPLMSFVADATEFDVPDPYKRDYQEYIKVFSLIRMGCDGLIGHLERAMPA
jgi:protein-tyrosine phosphatase